MKAADIQRALRRAPFKPFNLLLDNGTRIPVAHPDCLLFSASKRTCVIMKGEDWWMVDTSHLSGLTDTENGSARKKSERGKGKGPGR
jgi:hypothetical protein